LQTQVGGLSGYTGNKLGMYAWALHRLTGLGVVFFLLIHIIDTAFVLVGPELYNHAMALYKAPLFRPLELALAASVIYHALNGLRVTLIDFWEGAARIQDKLFYGVLVLFAVLFIPSAYFMLRPLFVH
jgi:succinate dehydrogenase / fumarate reductase cytochrome b subunit